jgi:23S rRNA U2552 (ribose-2'-O)-methylase RlmE/FtsJ
MNKKIIKAISEQTEIALSKFSEERGYSLQDVADQFVLFSDRFQTFEEAINNLPAFVNEFYVGTNINKFKDTIRSGYEVIVDELIEGSRKSLENRVLRVI